MKPRTLNTLTLSIFALASIWWPLVPVLAQFDSGSTGAGGALNVTTDTTLDLPPDGVFHFTTISVGAGATLSFKPNDLNTAVHLLATGAVTISGIVDISASAFGLGFESAGGPGGFSGGKPGISSSNLASGAGQGPGGGAPGTGITVDERAGAGSYGAKADDFSPKHGDVYGNPLLIPLAGGSGGGGSTGNPGVGGGGGGGALLVASNASVTITGEIRARGGTFGNHSNTGSGGAIRIVAPAVSGNGTLDVNPNTNHGRIRVDTFDRSGMSFVFKPIQAATTGVAMIGIPDPLPRLRITNVAGTAIPENASGPVSIILPFGSDPNRTVTVQARDFGSSVPIRVTLTPEHGDRTSVDTVIENQASNPAQTIVAVTFPVGVPTSAHVWTR